MIFSSEVHHGIPPILVFRRSSGRRRQQPQPSAGPVPRAIPAPPGRAAAAAIRAAVGCPPRVLTPAAGPETIVRLPYSTHLRQPCAPLAEFWANTGRDEQLKCYLIHRLNSGQTTCTHWPNSGIYVVESRDAVGPARQMATEVFDLHRTESL